MDTYAELPFEQRPAYAELRGSKPARSLRTRAHAAIESSADGVSRLAVFDRIVDRGERNDLAQEQPALCEELRQALQRAGAEFGARGP